MFTRWIMTLKHAKIEVVSKDALYQFNICLYLPHDVAEIRLILDREHAN